MMMFKSLAITFAILSSVMATNRDEIDNNVCETNNQSSLVLFSECTISEGNITDTDNETKLVDYDCCGNAADIPFLTCQNLDQYEQKYCQCNPKFYVGCSKFENSGDKLSCLCVRCEENFVLVVDPVTAETSCREIKEDPLDEVWITLFTLTMCISVFMIGSGIGIHFIGKKWKKAEALSIKADGKP
eukprot:Pgem_evm1s4498